MLDGLLDAAREALDAGDETLAQEHLNDYSRECERRGIEVGERFDALHAEAFEGWEADPCPRERWCAD